LSSCFKKNCIDFKVIDRMLPQSDFIDGSNLLIFHDLNGPIDFDLVERVHRKNKNNKIYFISNDLNFLSKYWELYFKPQSVFDVSKESMFKVLAFSSPEQDFVRFSRCVILDVSLIIDIDEDFDEKFYFNQLNEEIKINLDPLDRRSLFSNYFREGKIMYRSKNYKDYCVEHTKNIMNEKKHLIEYIPEDWQSPAITEKFAFLSHQIDLKTDNYYFAFPWASLIDNFLRGRISIDFYKDSIKEKISCLDSNKKIHTVCQHIFWKELIKLWEDVGITDIHLSHCTDSSQKATNKIVLHSWPLLAVNYELKDRCKKLLLKPYNKKKYLLSFVGSYMSFHRSDIRLKIKKVLEKTPNEKIYLKYYDEWHYQKIVYEPDSFVKEDDDIKTFNYNEVISESVFSLCPEGTGPNSLRLWESMAVGSIPVLFENDWIPPEIEGLGWSDFSIKIKNEEICDIYEKLSNIPDDVLQSMQFNCLNAYNQFRKKTCF